MWLQALLGSAVTYWQSIGGVWDRVDWGIVIGAIMTSLSSGMTALMAYLSKPPKIVADSDNPETIIKAPDEQSIGRKPSENRNRQSSAFAFSERSHRNLVGVHPDLVRLFEEVIKISPYDFAITEGVRSLERQALLFEQEKSLTMDSAHLYGNAVDIACLLYTSPSPRDS